MQTMVTLAKAITVKGIGVHTGAPVAVELRPRVPKLREVNAGIVLQRLDVPKGQGDFTLAADLSVPSPLATLLRNAEGTTLSTVEHLLSALHGLQVDALTIAVDGPELPILDGSGLPWVQAIDAAGRQTLDVPRAWLRVPKVVQHDSEGRVLRAEPDGRRALRVECPVDVPHPMIGRQMWRGVVDEAVFRAEIAPARTFVLEEDIAAAQAAGLAKGGSLANAVVFGRNGQVLNAEGLRFADEPVRHKVLDAVGDLFLAARPVAGKFYLTLPGHTANNALLRKLLVAETEWAALGEELREDLDD